MRALLGHDASLPVRPVRSVEGRGLVGLALGFGVVVLGLEGGPELDAALEEGAVLADGLEGAVELGGSGAAPIAEEPVVLAAEPRNAGAISWAGSGLGLGEVVVDLAGCARQIRAA
jgi:hypothetical protein